MKRKKVAQIYDKTSVTPDKQPRSNKFLHLVRPLVNSPYKPCPGNLPVSLTPFIGRQAEVEAICQLVNDPAVRLLTLYGTAGLGKTRLSLAVGEQLQNDFPDGVFFVNLAPLTKPEAGLTAIAQAVGLQDQRQLPLLKKLQNYLQSRAVLLILDNFEQVVKLGSAISELLMATPQLKVIITSRVVLRLYGEYVYPVLPLELPELAETTSPETLGQNEAVSLFVQQAKMVNPQFQLTAKNAETIARLCIHLEGLPLAIELAAARCEVFSPQALLDRLGAGHRFELLVGRFSNLPPRQQTLVEALEWSYDLLSEPEKQLFRSLGLFVGSCSLAAVEALHPDSPSTFETVISLLNKSLLRPLEALPGEELRFTMLETIREYALEKLTEAGELESVRAAYLRYFINMVETGADQLKKPDQLNWLKRLEADHPNILSALDYLIEHKQVEAAFRLGAGSWLVWWRWGYLNQGRQWLNKIMGLDGSEVEQTLQARLLDGVAYLAMYQSDYRTAQTSFEQSLKIWRQNGVSKQLAGALSGLAGTYRILGNYDEALQLNYESLDLFCLLGEKIGEADGLCNIGWQLMERGNYEPVQAMLEKSLALHSKAGYLSGIARTKIFLGDFLWRKNDPAQAIQELEEGIALLRQVNHRVQLPAGLYRLGLIYLCQGQLTLAEKVLEESIEIGEEIHKVLDLAYAYSSLGMLRLLQNDLVKAEALFRQALELRSEIGQLEGVLWAIEGLGVIALKQGRSAEAQPMLEEAQLLRQAISAPLLPHTLKFILPALLNQTRTLNPPSEPRKPSSRLANRKAKTTSLRPVAPILVNQAAPFGMEVAVALSERESEVLKLVAQGHPNSQIAKLLVISPGTVNNHLTSVYSKLGVNSRTAAVRYALDHRLL